MKKIVLSLFMGIFLISFALAQAGPADGTGTMHDDVIAAGGQDGNPTQGEGIGMQIRNGNYMNEKGQQMKIQQQENKKIRLEVGGIYADCECNMTEEQFENRTKLKTTLSNGRNAEIKIMPDTASVTALQKLKLKNCNEDCTIELKEVGQGEQMKLAYEMKAQRQSKFLGLFKANMQIQTQIDAETGEIIRTKKPWWSFLASESQEE